MGGCLSGGSHREGSSGGERRHREAEAERAYRPPFSPSTGSGTGSGGSRLGGDDVVASLGPRTAAAMAADARAAVRAPQEERLKREELIGKITEAYRRKGREVPFGLAAQTLPQLASRWAEVSSSHMAH